MSCEPITRNKDSQTKTAPNAGPEATVEQVIENIRRDSRVKVDEYLEETTVPHGGE